MKRKIALLLVLGMMFSLAACGGGANSGQGGSQNTGSSQAGSGSAPQGDSSGDQSQEDPGTVPQPDGFPSKTIELIVPAAAGAAMDIHARALNDALDLGTPLQITNMAGGSQTIGLMELATRKGDGYSLCIPAFAGMIIQPQLVEVTYTLDSFRPVAIVAGPDSYTVCTQYDEAADYDSFLAMLQSGETVHWTSPNAGSPAQLAGLWYLKELGVTNCEYVAYNGSAEALTALLSGDVDFLVTDNSEVATRAAEKQVSPIITLSDERCPTLTDVVCAEEKGVSGMGVFDGFGCLLIPKDTPDDIYNWIKQQVDAAVVSPSYQSYLSQNNLVATQTYTEQEMMDMLTGAYNSISEVIGLIG